MVWKTSKQSLVALSTCKAELIAASEACKSILWVRSLLFELGMAQKHPADIFEDNQGAQEWGTNGIRSAKHVSIRRNFVTEQVDAKVVKITHCPTSEMKADILTKPLGRVAFERHRAGLGVVVSEDSPSKKGC